MRRVKDYAQAFHLHWMRFATELKLKTEQQQSIYQLLFNAYTEPQRAYHTIQHIVECFDLLFEIRNELEDPISVETAIWFHDVIYDPKSSENELRSAAFMKQCCADVLDHLRLEKVYAWIMATQHHLPTNDQDLKYVLDIDLAILGCDEQRFQQYEQQIRQEYAWVKEKIYQIKRRAILKQFAEMKPLYQTLYFQKHFEMQAQLNLTRTVNDE